VESGLKKRDGFLGKRKGVSWGSRMIDGGGGVVGSGGPDGSGPPTEVKDSAVASLDQVRQRGGTCGAGYHARKDREGGELIP